MELKHREKIYNLMPGKLLIVPYGIETIVETIGGYDRTLLIVPYGIETKIDLSDINKKFF